MAFSGLLGQDLSCTSLQISVARVCAHVHANVYTYIIHTHTQNALLKRSLISQDSLKTDRICMSKASINIFACCRYVLLASNFSLKQNSKHELQAVVEVMYIKETKARKLSCQKVLEQNCSSAHKVWYDGMC